MMEVKKKQLVHLALLTATILLIFAQYKLYEKQQMANLDIGKDLSRITTDCVSDVLIRTKGITVVLCLLRLIITRLSSSQHFVEKKIQSYIWKFKSATGGFLAQLHSSKLFDAILFSGISIYNLFRHILLSINSSFIADLRTWRYTFCMR